MSDSERLRRLLLQYSASAGALLSLPAAAQVVYYDIEPDLVLDIGQSVNMDLNGDGIVDFAFQVTTYGTSWYFAGLAPQPPQLDNQNAFAGYTLNLGASPSIYAFASRFEYGVIIDENLPWLKLADMAWVVSGVTYYFHAGMVSNYYGNILGQWSNVADKYLALRFSTNGVNMHYAWMRCDVNAAGTQLILKDYAYNASPDLPIVSGLATKVPQAHQQPVRMWLSGNHLQVNLTQTPVEPFLLVLTDMAGRKVLETTVHKQHSTVSLEHLPAAVYLATLGSDHATILTRMLYLGF